MEKKGRNLYLTTKWYKIVEANQDIPMSNFVDHLLESRAQEILNEPKSEKKGRESIEKLQENIREKSEKIDLLFAEKKDDEKKLTKREQVLAEKREARGKTPKEKLPKEEIEYFEKTLPERLEKDPKLRFEYTLGWYNWKFKKNLNLNQYKEKRERAEKRIAKKKRLEKIRKPKKRVV